MSSNVTLQINLAPGDYLHARYILKHQLKVLSNQVSEVVLTIDTKPGKGRFAQGWQEYKKAFDSLVIADIQPNFRVKVIPVDYSDETKKKVADYFLGDSTMPERDYRGGPFYVYFFGLYSAANNLVMHLDSDILLGGQSQSWISEAINYFKDDASCFVVSPLPGLPHPDDLLIGQSVDEKLAPFTYSLNGMSTRLFMMDKSKFQLHKLKLTRPEFRNMAKAFVEGNPPAQLPEVLLSAYMKAHDFKRIDFVGTGKGMWSLHPPYRTNDFYKQLPHIIDRVETNDLPATQCGFYDIVDDLFDWSQARKALKENRWWKRLLM